MKKVEIQISSQRMKALQLGTETFRSVIDFHLTPEDLDVALTELNETEDKKMECLKELKERLASDKEVRYCTDDDFLLRYLRFRKYDCDRAYSSIKKLYYERKEHPEYFALPSKLEFFLNSSRYTFLPYRDSKGCVIAWMELRYWNTKEMSLCDIGQMALAVWDVISMNPASQINGVIGLWDLREISINHVKEFLYSSMPRLLINILQETYPWRIKLLVIVHCNNLVRTCYRIARPFMKKKFVDRIKFLGSDMNELHQYINPAILPKLYGGKLDESECLITQHVVDNLPYLKYERSFGYLSQK